MMGVRRKFLTGLAFTVTAIATAVAASAESTLSLLDQYQQICRDDYNSELEVSEDAVYNLLAGREPVEPVVVVDTSGLTCGQKPLGFCGSGGCDINLIIDEKLYVKRGGSPVNIQFNGEYLILLPLSGGMCGNLPNSSPCFRVLAWDEQLRTLNSPN